MGYDFMFMSLRAKGPFPLGDDAVPQTRPLPWHEFRDWLLATGGRVNGGDNRIWVEYPGEGSICFTGDEQCIYLDTHAEWTHVLRAYRKLKSLDPDACVIDPQPGLVHDERTFTQFMAEHGVRDERA